MALIDINHVARFVGEVLPHEIARVSPVFNEEEKRTSYMVINEEEKRDESGGYLQYEVWFHPQMGCFCTCDSGKVGFMNVRHKSRVCKHVRWVVAYLLERKAYFKKLAAKERQHQQQADELTRQEAIEKFMREHYIEIDGKPATAEQIERLLFKVSPRPSREEEERDLKRYGNRKPFSLM